LSTTATTGPPITEQTLETYIDVDYYVDEWERRLADSFNPKLLYTVTPETVARNDGEVAHTFNTEGELEMRVTGGATYRHKLWSYGQDIVTATRWFWFIPIRTTIYNVDRRRMRRDRSVVLLTPLARLTGISAILGKIFLSGDGLSRLDPRVKSGFRPDVTEGKGDVSDGKYLRLMVHTAEGAFISTGRCGEYACATISATQDHTLSTVVRNMSQKLNAPLVRSLIPDLSDEAAYVLVDFHRRHTLSATPVVCPVDQGIRHYQPLRGYNPEAKKTLEAFMSPIIPDQVYAPELTTANRQFAVDSRVKEVRSNVTPTTSSVRYASEFIELVVGSLRGTVHPYDQDVIWDRQPRPTQRSLFKQFQCLGKQTVGRATSFIKKEAYGKPTAPRLITIAPVQGKIRYLQIIHAFTDRIMKRQPWYASGMTPLKIAEAVSRVCQSANSHVLVTDYSRWDGHVSELIKDVQIGVLLAAMHPDYRTEVYELARAGLHEKVLNLPSGPDQGPIVYDSGSAQQSGRADTSVFGTIGNAYISYVAFRMQGASPQEAYASLGVYLGDDGLTADIPYPTLAKSAAFTGQKLDCNRISKGDKGVNFLARYYSPQVWYGETDSCCDIRRQLSKFHTASRMAGVTPADKLVQKAISYFLTDRHTPVIGHYCVAVLKHLSADELDDKMFEASEQLLSIRSWWGRFSDSQYPALPDAPWKMQFLHEQLPGFDLDMFRKAIWDSKSLDDLMGMPLCQHPAQVVPVARPAIPMVVHGALPHIITPSPNTRKGNSQVQAKTQPGNTPATTSKSRSKGTGVELKSVRSPRRPPSQPAARKVESKDTGVRSGSASARPLRQQWKKSSNPRDQKSRGPPKPVFKDGKKVAQGDEVPPLRLPPAREVKRPTIVSRQATIARSQLAAPAAPQPGVRKPTPGPPRPKRAGTPPQPHGVRLVGKPTPAPGSKVTGAKCPVKPGRRQWRKVRSTPSTGGKPTVVGPTATPKPRTVCKRVLDAAAADGQWVIVRGSRKKKKRPRGMKGPRGNKRRV
jgi:hypothetical protein